MTPAKKRQTPSQERTFGRNELTILSPISHESYENFQEWPYQRTFGYAVWTGNAKNPTGYPEGKREVAGKKKAILDMKAG